MFFLDRRAKHPSVTAGAPEIPADNPLLLEAIEIGDQFPSEDLPHGVAEHRMVFVEGKTGGGVEHDDLRVEGMGRASAALIYGRAFLDEGGHRFPMVERFRQHDLLSVLDRKSRLD